MANTFKNALAKDVGTTSSTVYTTPGATTSICIELDVCNTSSSGVSCDAYMTSGGNDYYIVKNAPVPAGGTLQVIAGQKIVLGAGDVLKVVSTAATSLDVVASILEGV